MFDAGWGGAGWVNRTSNGDDALHKCFPKLQNPHAVAPKDQISHKGRPLTLISATKDSHQTQNETNRKQVGHKSSQTDDIGAF